MLFRTRRPAWPRLALAPRFALVMVLALANAASSQYVPPFFPHTHAFQVETPPGVWLSFASPYVRLRIPGAPLGPENCIALQPTYGPDVDRCNAAGCWLPLGLIMMSVSIVEWSDNGAGGEFGRFVNGEFEGCDPDQVTHYAPTAQPGVRQISLTVDDALTWFDPIRFQLVATADDAPATVTVGVTVWDFTMNGPGANWRPTAAPDGQPTPIAVAVQPVTDHAGRSMRASVEIQMSGTSAVPGFCGNATVPDLPPKDLQFDPTEVGWIYVAPDYQSGISTGNDTSMSRTILCYDYGGWATVTAEAYFAEVPITGQTMARDAAHPDREFIRLPVDEDEDHIADGQDNDTASADKDGFSGALDTARDTEALRAGNPHKGDGFSRYEEYRGMRIGGAWRALDQAAAEVFVEARDGLGLGYFHKTGLIIIECGATDTDAAGVVNCFTTPATAVVNQKRILLRDGGTYTGPPPPPGKVICGETVGGPGVPSTITECLIFTATLDMWLADPYCVIPAADQPGARTRIIATTVSHELAHAVAMPHHENTGSVDCVMRYWTYPDIMTRHSDYCTTSPGEVVHDMRLR